MPVSLAKIKQLQQKIQHCSLCPEMFGPPVTGVPVSSQVILVGQAPGTKEIEVHRPFAWTAGKTLFKWFAEIGVEQDWFRQHIYMAAVCRCFPGKNPRGGDRVPSVEEIQHCAFWLNSEIKLLQPELIIPVGKLAINQFIPCTKLDAVIGKKHTITLHDRTVEIIPLPHPSGASTWHRSEPGIGLLQKALRLIAKHPAWRQSLGEK